MAQGFLVASKEGLADLLFDGINTYFSPSVIRIDGVETNEAGELVFAVSSDCIAEEGSRVSLTVYGMMEQSDKPRKIKHHALRLSSTGETIAGYEPDLDDTSGDLHHVR